MAILPRSSSATSKRYRTLLVNLIVLILTLFLLIGAAELLTRTIRDVREAPTGDFRLTASEFYRAHPTYGWLPRGGVDDAPHDRAGVFTSRFSTNSAGLRGMREYAIPKPQGAFRIAVLGDSFTWGWGVDDHETYPAVLDSLLAGKDVVNFGVTAFCLEQEFLYLCNEVLRYEPDMVVLGLCQNDIYVDRKASFVDLVTNRSPAEETRVSSLGRFKRMLGERSAAYALLVHTINRNRRVVELLVRLGIKDQLGDFAQLDPNLIPALDRYPVSLEESWGYTERELLMMSDFLDEQDIQFVIAFIPAIQTVDDEVFQRSIAYSRYEDHEFDREKPYRRLAHFAEDHSILCVNPVSLFVLEQRNQPLYFTGDMHFNEAGHRLFAHAILEELNRSAVLE